MTHTSDDTDEPIICDGCYERPAEWLASIVGSTSLGIPFLCDICKQEQEADPEANEAITWEYERLTDLEAARQEREIENNARANEEETERRIDG